MERVFEVAHLSSIPVMTSDDENATDPSKAVRLIVAEPTSVFADAIRNARRALDMRRVSGNPRIVLLTSTVAGEGAELMASNLAHHYAMSGTRVLLIDADMRRLPLTRQLANGRQAGLLEQVTNNRPLEGAILRDALTGLYFLPAIGPNPTALSIPEVLGSRGFGDAINGLRGRFDTIIVSAPPLLPVIDGRILADYADQIVFVVAWQRTPKQLVKNAMKTLGYNEKKVAGVMLNEVSLDAMSEAEGLPVRAEPRMGQNRAPRRAA